MDELEGKLSSLRREMGVHGLSAVRLRGVDWFSWITCGGSSVVIFTTEVGVAEVLVSSDGAWVLTDEIEAERLRSEEVPAGFEFVVHPWQDASLRERFVRDVAKGGTIASDRPADGERALPAEIWRRRWSLSPEEIARYRLLGRDAARAVTSVLRVARPEWTGYRLAGAAAEALWAVGAHPTLTLVGEERRLPIHRHATASSDPLGARCMLVVCARRQGLFANLTRFVYFRAPTPEERTLVEHVALVEAAALDASRPGSSLGHVLEVIARTYAELGHRRAENSHHQGGSCGYLSRDVVAKPSSREQLELDNAVAWNPSLPGAKIEDTALVTDSGIEILTLDESWPMTTIGARRRPDLLLR